MKIYFSLIFSLLLTACNEGHNSTSNESNTADNGGDKSSSLVSDSSKLRHQELSNLIQTIRIQIKIDSVNLKHSLDMLEDSKVHHKDQFWASDTLIWSNLVRQYQKNQDSCMHIVDSISSIDKDL
jgi:hypothetical protein